MFDSGPCDWLGLPLLLPTPTTQFSLDHKRRSRKRNRKKWKRSDSSDSDSVELPDDSAYDSDIRFSLGHKLSYDSDYDSDSVASENQPLGNEITVNFISSSDCGPGCTRERVPQKTKMAPDYRTERVFRDETPVTACKQAKKSHESDNSRTTFPTAISFSKVAISLPMTSSLHFRARSLLGSSI